MKKHLKRLSPIDRVFHIVLGVIMTLLVLSYVYMYIWLLCNSLRSPGEYMLNTFKLFDFKDYSLDHYKELFTTQIAGSRRHPIYITDTILTTIILVAGQVLLAVTIPAFTAYIIAKYDFKGKKFILNVSIIQIVVPALGGLAATYRLIDKMGLVNSYFSIFLMAAGGFGFGFLLFRNFFAAIPWEYAESAFLDGATDMQVFLKIMYPQATPILAAIAVTSFIATWNDYFTAYIYLPEKPTISLAVSRLYTKMESRSELPVAFSGMTILATVSLIIFACFNKVIMSNLSAGGIKG